MRESPTPHLRRPETIQNHWSLDGDALVEQQEVATVYFGFVVESDSLNPFSVSSGEVYGVHASALDG